MTPVPAESPLTVPVDDARRLADWTRLDIKTLSGIYAALRRRQPGGALRDPKVERMEGVSDEEQRLALCRAVQARNLLVAFCLDVVAWELNDSRPGEEADDILRDIANVGQLHGITNRARDFGRPHTFVILTDIYRATCYIENENHNVIGTGFLVGRDIVLTAAHVVLRREARNGVVTFAPPIPEKLQIVFPETPIREQRAGLHSTHPLLAHARPFVDDAGNMLMVLSNEAAQRIDYALLHLDRPIADTKPVSLDGLAAPSCADLCYVIGYPESTDPVYDADQIKELLIDGGRLIHMMNAVPGMSGSCCVSNNGVAVALHEGDFPVVENGIEQRRNRAVLLRAIKTHLLTQNPKALVPNSSPNSAIFSRELVLRLGKRGQQLAAGEQQQGAWNAFYHTVLATHPSAPAPPDWDWHPCFTHHAARNGIEDWFARAQEPNVATRVLCIDGPPGSGKSFCIDRLAARLDEPLRDLIRMPLSGGSTAIDSLAAQLACATDREAARTTAGAVKYERVEDIIDAMSRFGGRDQAERAQNYPLFLAIDTGTDAEPGLATADWLMLLVALAARPWVRIVVCGLAADAITRTDQALAADNSTVEVIFKKETLEHARRGDIVKFIKEWTPPGEQPNLEPNAVADAFEKKMEGFTASGNLATALAALVCIGAIDGGSRS